MSIISHNNTTRNKSRELQQINKHNIAINYYNSPCDGISSGEFGVLIASLIHKVRILTNRRQAVFQLYIFYALIGSSRQVQVATEAVHSLQKLLRKHNEFTVLASVKQQENNTGSIITLSVDGQR